MTRLIFAMTLTCALLVAAPPIAKYTSAGPFLLSGTSVPTDGIPNWPLVAGDEIVTKQAPGEADFADGTRILVLPNTRITFDRNGNRTLVRLMKGAVAYKFAKDSYVDLAAKSHKPLDEKTRQGRLYALDDGAYWDPSGPAFYMLGAGNVLRRVSEGDFQAARLTPFDLNYVGKWRDFNPEWGNPPGGVPPTSGPKPPPPMVHPPELRPTSPWR